ncbi:MAG TPA: VOC family protein [Steroidobacteraceae bacterium]|nr:VOC family protein [Steroidobacteraceae bacterium]
MKITVIDHVQLSMPVGEEQRAREFYEGVLGLKQVPKPAELAVRGGAWFENDSVKVHLGVEADFRPARKAHPAFVVEDLSSLIALLQDRGYLITPAETLDGVERVHVADPFGNRIELINAHP